MIRRFYQNHRATIEKYDQFLLNNPVLERGLVVAPIIVTCNTLGNACALSIAFAFITLLAVALTFFIPRKKINEPFHTAIITHIITEVAFFISHKRVSFFA